MQKRCLLTHFETLQFSSHGSKGNLAWFSSCFYHYNVGRVCKSTMLNSVSPALRPPTHLTEEGFRKTLGMACARVYADPGWVQEESCSPGLSEWDKGIKLTNAALMKRCLSPACWPAFSHMSNYELWAENVLVIRRGRPDDLGRALLGWQHLLRPFKEWLFSSPQHLYTNSSVVLWFLKPPVRVKALACQAQDLW